MHLQGDVVLVLVEEQVLEVVFDFVDEKDGRTYLAFSVADGAFLLDLHFCFGADALPGDLDEAKLGGRQDGVLGTVARHLLAEFLEEFLAVLGLVQVDEIDDDDAAHIAQTQLACDFDGGFQIDLKCVFLLRIFLVHAMAAVHVDDVHGLGVFDDEVDTVSDGDNATEKAFDLLADIEIVENRVIAFVKTYNVGSKPDNRKHTAPKGRHCPPRAANC